MRVRCPAGEPHWEVIVIRRHMGRIWPNGDVTRPGEAYPSSESWGQAGWTFTPGSHRDPLAAAKAKFDSLA